MVLLHKLKERRIISGILAACLLLAVMALLPRTCADAVSVTDFSDVPQGAWYYDAVSYAVGRGLFNGTSATQFSPGGSMTRGMFVTVLGRFAGVDPDAWRAGKITGSGVNLRSGAGTSYSVITTLGKNASVTILGQSGDWFYVRTGSQTGYVSKDFCAPVYHRFSDVDYGAYYAGYVIWGYEKGIVNGVSSDSFAPNSDVTREQICKLLAGYASYAGITLRDSGTAADFTDQSEISSWASAGVAAMQRAGVVMGEKSGSGYRFRPKSSATRAEAAIIFQRFADASGGSAPAPEVTHAPTQTPAPEVTPLPQTTPAPSTDQPINAASFLSEGIVVKSRTIRVGILANTKNYKYAVSSVTLENLSGSGFQYGWFADDRSFQTSGDLNASYLKITTDGSTFTVRDGSGNTLLTIGGNLAIRPAGGGTAVTRVNGEYRYRGAFELRQAYNASGSISVINYVDIEDYVKGVIPYEYGNTWPAETLKAAAVCARNFVMGSDWSVYASYGLDVMANTSAQLYRGRGITYSESYYTATDAAVDATAGVYLTYNDGSGNRLCTTYYFACDGGATEDYAHIWGGSGYSYLIGKVDPYEAAASGLASNYTYSITNSRTGATMRSLARSVGLGDTNIVPNGIRIETYPATGNVKSVTITGENGWMVTIDQTTSTDRWDFLSLFGFTAYSYRYSVTYDASSDSFTCTRLGWGHGIGLSQWGAYAMAASYGKTYQEILGFYYDGTHLQYGVY